MKKSNWLYKSTVIILLITLVSSSVSYASGDSSIKSTYQTISMTDNDSAVIKSDGSLWMWGSNGCGQLGDGTFINRHYPVKIMDNVLSVVTNAGVTAAIKTDGSLWMWGANNWGQLGDGTFINRNYPVKIMDNVLSVSSIGYATIVIKIDGSLWMWGFNEYGEVGDGTTINRSTPIKIMSNVLSVSSYIKNTTIVIKTDGSLWGWGSNEFSQLGDGTKIDRSTPAKIMDNVLSASSGTISSAIKKDGSLWMWGYNYEGSLGDGTFIDKSSPVKIMDNVLSVTCLGNKTAAIKKDGSLWVWGSNDRGELGDGTTINRSTPIKIMDNVVYVSLEFFTSAIKSDGSLWIWGGEGWDALITSLTPIKVMDGVVSLCNENGLYLVIKEDESLWVFDSLINYSLGFFFNAVVGHGNSSPVKVMDNVVSVTTGNRYSLLKNDGSFWIWGDNLWGNIGDDTTIDRVYPVMVIEDVMLPEAITPISTYTQTATPTASKVLVNGNQITFDAYTIYGNNYFKLRDLATVVNGTEKQFEVTWDGTQKSIILISNKPYTTVGGEMSQGTGITKTPVLNTSKIYKDGEEIELTAYTINGNNYFKLRDIAKAFDIGVTWDGVMNTIIVDTTIGYVEP